MPPPRRAASRVSASPKPSETRSPPGRHGTGLAGASAAFDAVLLGEGSIDLKGWLVGPEYPIDRARLVVDGVPVGEAAVSVREDVGRHFPAIPHAARSGIGIQGARPRGDGPTRIELIGIANGRDVIAHEHYRWPTDPQRREVPPQHLIARIAGTPDEALFRDYGLTIAAQLLHGVRAHLPERAAPRLLDWGCGPGRATEYLFDLWPAARIVGCDIDPEAIGWARQRMPAGEFHVTGPYPPLPFETGSFDAVIASSVMTHLTAPVQLQWLREIRRVLRPGGVFVCSVLGPFSARDAPGVGTAKLRGAGILDWGPDAALDGIAPENFYRGTFQTIEYTYAQWGADMPVIAYREAGLVNHQDLVVLRHATQPRHWLRRLWP